MKPIEFKQQNTVFTAPKGVSEEECGNLPAYRSGDGQFPYIISCWELTPDEIEQVKQTGRIWLSISGGGMPPVALMAESPFIEKEVEP
jgi:hypothetical protein